MGEYINENSKGIRLPIIGKADALIADGAIEIPADRVPVKAKDGLVMVVRNPQFDAALHVNNDHDFNRVLFARKNGDTRPTRWLEYEHASALAGLDDKRLRGEA